MDANLAGTYTLIYSFLCKHSHTKAAKAVKKAAKGIVVVKEGVDVEGPPLDIIIKEWKAYRVKADEASLREGESIVVSGCGLNWKRTAEKSESTSNLSDSDSSPGSSNLDSSSGSNSNDLKDSSDPKTKKKLKKQNSRNAVKITSESNAKTSSPDFVAALGAGTKSDGKPSDFDQTDVKKLAQEVSPDSGLPLKHRASWTDSNSRPTSKKEEKESTLVSAASDLDSKNNSKTAPDSPTAGSSKNLKKTTLRAKREEELPLGSSEAIQVAKKRRTDESGAGSITATAKTEESPESSPYITGGGQANGKAKRKLNVPFQRIKPDKVVSHVVQDNRYTAKAAPNNDYGARAHNDLIVTRGAGFRKEKNKKKRGSYKGGAITLESHSFKFD